MKVPNINEIKIKPSDRKMKRVKQAAETLKGAIPKDLPLEKEVRFVSAAETLERIKDKIQIAINNIKK